MKIKRKKILFTFAYENRTKNFYIEAYTKDDAWRKANKEKRWLNITGNIELIGWDRREFF